MHPLDLSKFTAASRHRLDRARRIADDLRHDEALHRLAMSAVFLLEDTHEALSRASRPAQPRNDHRW